MAIKTIFLDRDGVINLEVNYLHKISEFKFIDGIFEACQYFHKLGYKIIIVTNQSGIARGYYTELEFDKLSKWLNKQFKNNNIDILDTFHCPHGPDSSCYCRKPKPGMFFEAQNKHDVNQEKSWMIGDSETDIQGANSAGIKNTILVSPNHLVNKTDSSAKFIINSIEHIEQVIIN